MVFPYFRNRTGYIVLGITLGHLLLISTQVNNERGVPVLEAMVFGMFAEVQRAGTTVLNSGKGIWTDYLALQTVRDENKKLKEQVSRLQVQRQEDRALMSEVRGLRELLDFRASSSFETIAATLIGSSPSPEFRTVTINKGKADGVRPDMAVITPAGVVGRIITPNARASQVQLLIDRNAAAGAMLERSRSQGIVVGGGSNYLNVNYLSRMSDIRTDDQVVTSGVDGIYPKGLLIGKVESFQLGILDFTEIVIRPAVDFSSLEHVLIIVTPLVTTNFEDEG